MKTFQFSLEAVRTLRQRQEQTALEQYAKAVQDCHQANAHLQSVQKQIESTWLELQTHVQAGAPSDLLQKLQSFCTVLDARRVDAEKAIETAKAAAHRAWEALLTARQHREAVDKFYEHQRLRHDRALQREDQRTLDELCRPGLGSALMTPIPFETTWN
jgi:flagellar export protein FliJ